MILRLIEASAKHRWLTLLIVLALSVSGWFSMKTLSIDAIPDLSDTQVIVYSTWNASPDIMEDQVTYPIISALLGVPKVKDIRGLSMYGASYVYVIFEDGTDIYWARSRVLEYLSTLNKDLPAGVKTQMGPDATGVGWIYQYALVDRSGQHSLEELRSFQDWFLRYQLQALPGVAEVASFGGPQKQYQVQINPEKLRTYNITLSQVMDAIKQGNSETGARVIEYSGTEYMIRARGYAKSRADLENIVVQVDKQGTPIYVKNIGRVALGPDMRRGLGDLDGEGEAVGGVIVMRFGENAHTVISNVKAKIAEIQSSFPDGIEIVETYDRSALILEVIDTLVHELTLEILVVAAIIVLFLMHLPSALVPIITLPIALLISFIAMRALNVSANVMSLAGIAIAICDMVDAAIVVVENCHKKIEDWHRNNKKGPLSTIILDAIREVGPASFYSLLVLAVSFLPIFALDAQEGRLFHPLAYTKTLAMMVGAILAITLVPALLMIGLDVERITLGPQWLRSRLESWIVLGYRPEEKHPISRTLFRVYSPCVDWVVAHRIKVVIASLLIVVATLPVYFKLGSEFMPPLNEGTILYMPTTMPGISVTEAQKLLQKQDAILKSFPEVLRVHGKAGAATTATDSAPLSMMETVVVLKDQREWRSKERYYSNWPHWIQVPLSWITPEYMTWNELVAEMDAALQIPGQVNAWTMPIRNRIDMLSTGIRTPIGIKVSGAKLEEIERVGIEIEQTLHSLPETRSVFAERVVGAYFLDFKFNRQALARHGISMESAHRSLSAALGGENVTTTVEGRERYTVNVRYARAFRQERADLASILLEAPNGHQIPLSQVASIEASTGPGMIRNENGLLTAYVYIDTTQDVGTYVTRAKEAIAEKVKLQPGYSLTWSGQYQNMARVRETLKLVIPLTLVIILTLIYMNTGSAMKTAIVLLAIPFSAVGAIWLLYALDYNMSIAVWVGLIALLGVDAETAIYMLLYLDLAYEERVKEGRMQTFEDLRQAIHEGAVRRIRPKLMTVLTTFIALLPIMVASSADAGADVMKRMAAPMVGGIFTSFLLELLVYPAIFAIWKSRSLPQEPLAL
jgi:Cu(I)/Ag(I) efflux system membrane protein CusA/SilA